MRFFLASLFAFVATFVQGPAPKNHKPLVPTKLYITFYIDSKGAQLKPQRKVEIKDKATIQKFEKMFKQAFDRKEGSEPAGWKAGTWLRFEDEKHRSREVGFDYKFEHWSWGKGDFQTTKDMKTAVWHYYSQAKPVKASQQ